MTIRFKYLVRFAAALGLLQFGIAARSSAESVRTLFPGGVGSRWVFDCELTMTRDGKPEVTKLAMEGRITGVSKVGRQKRIVMRMGTTEMQTGEDTYLLDDKQLLRVSTGAYGIEKMTPPLPLLRAPIKPGITWTWSGTKLGKAGDPHKAKARMKVGGLESVMTPAGTFKTYPVEMNLEVSSPQGSIPIPATIWFAPRVGMVRIKTDVTAGPLTVKFDMLLSKYSIK